MTGSAANSATTVNSGGTLAGTGTVGAVTMNEGGSLTPGKFGVGTLRTGGITTTGGTFRFDITNTGSHDILSTTGGISLTGGTLVVSLTSGYTLNPVDTFTIWQNDGIDLISGIFSGLPEGSSIPIGQTSGGHLDYDFWTISYVGGTGNDVVLTYHATPVPEPTVLTFASTVILLVTRRRDWLK